MSNTIKVLRGQDVQDYIEELAALRVEIFRDFPYLYEGTMAYEARYLQTLARSDNSRVVLALDGRRAVGASTALPLIEADADFQKPYSKPDEYFYFGESVLKAEYRGRGLGHVFFDEREKAAREGGYGKTCFCAVVRPPDHPLRPEGYRPLDGFWKKRGYKKMEGRTCTYSWTDIGEDKETEKLMQFWERSLNI